MHKHNYQIQHACIRKPFLKSWYECSCGDVVSVEEFEKEKKPKSSTILDNIWTALEADKASATVMYASGNMKVI